MQKMVSYDYRKSFYISGHIPGTIRGKKSKSYHILKFYKKCAGKDISRPARPIEPSFWGTKRGFKLFFGSNTSDHLNAARYNGGCQRCWHRERR